jgi:hypothetical protein
MEQTFLLFLCCCGGFMSGYGVRAMISKRRRREARRAWEAREALEEARKAREAREARLSNAHTSSAIDIKASTPRRTQRKPRVTKSTLMLAPEKCEPTSDA